MAVTLEFSAPETWGANSVGDINITVNCRYTRLVLLMVRLVSKERLRGVVHTLLSGEESGKSCKYWQRELVSKRKKQKKKKSQKCRIDSHCFRVLRKLCFTRETLNYLWEHSQDVFRGQSLEPLDDG